MTYDQGHRRVLGKRCNAAAISVPDERRNHIQRLLFYHRKCDGRPMTLGSQHGCLAPLKTLFKWLAPLTGRSCLRRRPFGR